MPCTKTTGMSPGWYGVVETSGGRSKPREPAQEPEQSRARTIGMPVNVSASAAVGSLSSGTFSPAIETDSASQAR